MKNIFTSVFLLFAVTAFAQDTKKDTAQLYDYGARIYDARIERYMSVDPQQSKENTPYQFADTTAEQHSNDGEEYMKQKNLTAAFNSFSKAIQINPIAKYYTKRAVCSMFQVKPKEALVDFDNAIKIDPNYAEAYLFKGSIYQYNEDYDIAIDNYTKAIKANPSYTDAYMMRGLLFRTRNSKDACKDLKKAIDLGSKKAIEPYQEFCK